MTKFLFCTDGSPYCHTALHYISWIAKHIPAEFHCLYVSNIEQIELSLSSNSCTGLDSCLNQNFILEYQNLENQKSEAIHKQCLNFFQEQGIQSKLHFIHKTGHIADRVTELEKDMDIIILGKRGESANFAKDHLGSSMERVIRTTKKPCLLTPREFTEPKRLLLAFDGSYVSAKALEFITQNPLFKTCELHIVTVLDNITNDQAAIYQHQAAAVAKDNGITPICHILNDTAEDAIEAYALNNNINLLVIGAQGHSRIRDFFVGSTSTALIRQCKIPVLLYR